MTITLVSVMLVVAAGVSYAVLDLLRKRLTVSLASDALLFWLAATAVPLFLGAAALDGAPWRLESGYWGPGMVSIVVNIAANLAFLKALEVAPLGVTIPLLSLTPVFATLLSIRVLGELPAAADWAGIACVVIGAFILNYDPGDGVSVAAAWRSLVQSKGSLLMIGTALGWSITPAFDKLAVEASGTYEHGALLNLGVALGALGFVLARGRPGSLRLRRADLWPLGASAVVGFVALAVLLEAYKVAWIGFVETVRRAVNSALALVFGRAFFGESIGRLQVTAVILMSVGVGLIFL